MTAMWRWVGLGAVAVVAALVVAYVVAVIWLNNIGASNERKATADVEAIARSFEGETLTAVKQGPVTTGSLRTLQAQAGMILARQSGNRVVVTFEVTEAYAAPPLAQGTVNRCYTETIDRHGSDVTASISNLDCARIPVPGPLSVNVTPAHKC